MKKITEEKQEEDVIKIFDDNELYTTDEASRGYRKKNQTFRRWRSNGVGPPYIKIGRNILYPGAGLNSHINGLLVKP